MATGAFSDIVLTETGRNMVVRSQNGEELAFKHVILSDGLLNGRDPTKLTNVLGSNQLKIDIRKFTDKGDGQYQVQFILSNQEVEEGFWHREIGLFAQIGNEQPKLYAYTNAGSNAAFMHDKNTPVDERRVSLDFVVGNAENLTVVINSSILYATLEDLEEHNDSENAHEILFKTAENDAEVEDNSKKGASTSWTKKLLTKFESFKAKQISDFASAVKQVVTDAAIDIFQITAKLESNGFIKSGLLWGFTVQWGYGSTFKQSDYIIFNIPFYLPLICIACMKGSATEANSFTRLKIDTPLPSKFKATFENANSQGSGVFYIALGCSN